MKTKAAPANCRKCSRWKEVKQRIKVSEVLTKALAKFEGQTREKNFRLSLPEYLKLLQLEKEFEENEPKEVTVTWIEPEISGAEK